MVPHTSEAETIRNRLRDLNTKAYYLLVALGFIYGTSGGSGWLLKTALALTALAAVLPLQDLVKPVNPMPGLGRIRNFKIACLSAALFCTLWWIATAKPVRTLTEQPSEAATAKPDLQTCPENDPLGLLSKEPCKPISSSKSAPPCPPTDPLGLKTTEPCAPQPPAKSAR